MITSPTNSTLPDVTSEQVAGFPERDNTPKDLRPPLDVCIVFGLLLFAVLFMTCSHLALLYDGGLLFVTTVNNGRPSAPYFRLGMAIFEYPAIFASQLTGSVNIAKAAFCAMFSVPPLISIVLSWYVIRDHKPWLFVWPVLSIGLMSIFAQPFRVGESLIVCDLAWPLLLAILVPMTVARVFGVIALGLLLASLHPNSLTFLAVAAVSGLGLASLGGRKDSKLLFGAAISLLLITALRFAMVLLYSQPYELGELDPKRVSEHIQAVLKLSELPIAVAAATLSGLLLIASDRLKKRWLFISGCVLALVSGALAVFWSSTFSYWFQCWSYLRFLPILLIPTMLFCIIDSISTAKFNKSRAVLVVASAALFAVSAFIQSNVLNTQTFILQQDIRESKDTIIDMSEYSWSSNSPFQHWSLPSYAIATQGRYPQKIVLPHECVAQAKKDGLVKLVPWEPPFQSKWFKLPAIEQE